VKEDERVIYSINIEDIQTVAVAEFGRALTDSELQVVEDNLGDYIKWYDIIDVVISAHLQLARVSSELP
jgi:hypothetical protein